MMIDQNTSNSQELQVRPLGWASAPETERFPLSLMGYSMPKIYVQMAEVFEVPEDADYEVIIKNIMTGLEFTLSQYRILVGGLFSNDGNGEMWVETRRDSTVPFVVKHIANEGEFPSFKELEEKDFPANLLPGAAVLPKFVNARQFQSPFNNEDEEGISSSAFQLTFIRGGMILGLAAHHTICDGPGCDGFLTTWAENTRAAAVGEPFIPLKEIEKFELKGSPMDVSKPEKIEGDALLAKYPFLRDAGGPMPPPPPGFQMPKFANQMLHFSRSNLEALKEFAMAKLDGDWVSTYDCIMALIWASHTRSQIDHLRPNLESETKLLQAIDSRKRYDPPLPARFFGVGAIAALADPLKIADVIDPEKLPLLASTIRTSVRATTPECLTSVLKWIASRDDKRYLEFPIKMFLGMDFGGTSWIDMKPYENHDFGFGCAKALRWPDPQVLGSMFMYPSRAAHKPADADEGIEVCVTMEESYIERLTKDETLLRYATPRG